MMRSRLRTPTRAAASSIARGSPSRSAHTSATACSWPSRANDGSVERGPVDEQPHGRRRRRSSPGPRSSPAPRAAAPAARARRGGGAAAGEVTSRVSASLAPRRPADQRGAVRKRLQVVQHHQGATGGRELGQRVAQVAAGLAAERQRHVDGQLRRRGRLGDLEVDDVGVGVLHRGGDQGRHPGLARAPDAGQGHQAHVGAAEQVPDLGGQVGAAVGGGGEHRDPGAPSRHHRRRVARAAGQGRVVAQDPGLELLEGLAGRDAELVGQALPGLGVDLDRLVGPAAAVERGHQQRPEPFAGRVLLDQPAHVVDEVGGVAVLEDQVAQVLDRGEPGLVEPGRLVGSGRP